MGDNKAHAIDVFKVWAINVAAEKAIFDDTYPAFRNRVESGDVHAKGTLQQVYTENGTKIEYVTLMCSEDDGKTWEKIAEAWC